MMSSLLTLFCLILNIYGIYLGFRAHMLLGIVLIFVPLVPLVFAVVMLLFQIDLAQRTVAICRGRQY